MKATAYKLPFLLLLHNEMFHQIFDRTVFMTRSNNTRFIKASFNYLLIFQRQKLLLSMSIAHSTEKMKFIFC